MTRPTRLAGLIIAAFILTAYQVAPAPAPPTEYRTVIPLLIRAPTILNGEFELKTHDGACFWVDWSTASPVYYRSCPQEVAVPSFWRAGWHNQFRDGLTPTGQPEMRLTDPLTDPGRARSGQALMWFTFYRRQWVWIDQPVPHALDGRLITAQAHVQVWDSQCSTKPFHPPLDSSCQHRLEDNLKVRICINSTCSPWQTAYCDGAPCWHQLTLGPYHVTSPAHITIEACSRHPYKHQNVYIDEVILSHTQALQGSLGYHRSQNLLKPAAPQMQQKLTHSGGQPAVEPRPVLVHSHPGQHPRPQRISYHAPPITE
jgi:hypothetical protein